MGKLGEIMTHCTRWEEIQIGFDRTTLDSAVNFSAKKATPRLGIRFRCISEWPPRIPSVSDKNSVLEWCTSPPPDDPFKSREIRFRAGKGDCLLDTPDKIMERTDPRRLPGEDYSVNKQCELVFGNGSRICNHMVDDGKSVSSYTYVLLKDGLFTTLLYDFINRRWPFYNYQFTRSFINPSLNFESFLNWWKVVFLHVVTFKVSKKMRKEKKMITIINFDWLSFFESMNLRGRNIILNEEQYCKIVLIIFTLNYHDQNLSEIIQIMSSRYLSYLSYNK